MSSAVPLSEKLWRTASGLSEWSNGRKVMNKSVYREFLFNLLYFSFYFLSRSHGLIWLSFSRNLTDKSSFCVWRQCSVLRLLWKWWKQDRPVTLSGGNKQLENFPLLQVAAEGDLFSIKEDCMAGSPHWRVGKWAAPVAPKKSCYSDCGTAEMEQKQ